LKQHEKILCLSEQDRGDLVSEDNDGAAACQERSRASFLMLHFATLIVALCHICGRVEQNLPEPSFDDLKIKLIFYSSL
jgi:hypothetical protein